MNKIKQILQRLKIILYDYIEDLLIFIGLAIIVITTLKLSFYIGMYTLAVILISLGIYLAKNPLKRG